jgi:CheY-like chemotaxis protein
MRILYVEDNEVNRALIERVMRARQCSVVFQDEGEGALEVLAQDPKIDLILLDIELAGAINGLDVIRTMRARNDHRPVVAITAYAMMGDRERILEAGCDQYLPKPLVVTDLLNLIDHYQAQFAKKATGEKAITCPWQRSPPCNLLNQTGAVPPAAPPPHRRTTCRA